MNILFISDHLKSGGKERRLTELIKELVARGKVTPILMLLNGIDAKSSIDYKSVLDLRIKIYYLGNYNRWKMPLQIFKICKKEKIHIINTWAPPVYTYLAYPSKLFLKIPILNNSITSARNDIRGFNMLKIRGTYLISDVILSNSHQALKIFKVPKKKRIVIYNGFRQDRLNDLLNKTVVRNNLNIQTEFIVSMAAEYSYRKDYPTYIQAANIVLDKGYDVTFLCMGSGNYENYQKLVDPNYKGGIKFLERQSDVESIMNASDIGALASSVEGIPNSILECMAIGIPVIANSGEGVGTKELIDDGVNGYLVIPNRPDLFADKIMYLLDNQEIRNKMGEHGKKIAQEKFNLKKMVDSFSELFEKDNLN